jgi:hypothetical protein
MRPTTIRPAFTIRPAVTVLTVMAVVTTATLALAVAAAVTTDPTNASCAGPAASSAATPRTGDQIETGVGSWSVSQVRNATAIIAVGQRRHIPARGWIIAVATAMQESTLHDLANPDVPESMALPHEGTGNDHDSVGLFQQRPSAGWGSVTELMDPATAAGKFYTPMLQVPGWQSMALTAVAQRVQRSAFPGAYATWEDPAERLVASIARVASITQLLAASNDSCPSDCPQRTNADTWAAMVEMTPARTCDVLARAAAWQTAWQGSPVPYVSSSDPATWFHGYRRDCSGYASMALGLPGPGLDTAALAAASTPVSRGALTAGDLLINPAAGPDGHVVIFDRWTDATRSHYWGYEQAGDTGTTHHIIPFPYYGTYPMTPYRFHAGSTR